MPHLRLREGDDEWNCRPRDAFLGLPNGLLVTRVHIELDFAQEATEGADSIGPERGLVEPPFRFAGRGFPLKLLTSSFRWQPTGHHSPS